MAQSLRLVGGVDLAAAPRAFALRPGNDGCGAQSPNIDWDLARLTKANLVLVGTERIVSDFVIALWRYFDGPIVVWRRSERLRLSPTSEPVGTIVLHGVDTLTPQEQRALYHWLSARNGRTRVVSTVSASLLQRVEARAFSDGLYYRLNTVCVDLNVPPDTRRANSFDHSAG